MIVFIKVKLLTNKDMKQIIDEINKSYELFVDADDHARLDDMCKEIACIRKQAERLIEECDDYINDLNIHV